MSLHMMHMPAHCAHHVHGHGSAHAHSPYRGCAVCAVPAIAQARREKAANLIEYTSRVGGAHG
jgi:hypothetical protein